MKKTIFSIASSALAMVSLVGCTQVEGQKPKPCEPGSSERCPYVNTYDVPTSGKYGTTTVVVPTGPGRAY